MTLKLIQQRSRDIRAKTRRRLLGTLSGPLAAGFFYAWGMKEFPTMRQVQPAFALALAWSLAGVYFLNRGMWSPTAPSDAGLRTGLEFCLREIERQRDLARRVLLWTLGPVMLAIGTFVLALAMIGTKDRGLFPNGLPFLIAALVWTVVYFRLRVRERRELQREIEELNDIETGNR